MTEKEITPTELSKIYKSQEVMLIDVREPAEYRGEHIEHSTSIPLRTLNASNLPLNKNKYVFICQSGVRGESACKKISKQKLSSQQGIELLNLVDGVSGWKELGLPIIKGTRNVPSIARQTQLLIGLLISTVGILALFYDPIFVWLTVLFGIGLVNAGLTGWCGLGKLIARMPWNR